MKSKLYYYKWIIKIKTTKTVLRLYNHIMQQSRYWPGCDVWWDCSELDNTKLKLSSVVLTIIRNGLMEYS